MASKAGRLRKVYEVKIGKKIVDKLSDKQIKILSAFYNSLSDKEQSDLDSQIIMGRNNTELHEMAIGMIEEEENTEDKMPEGLDDLLNEISGNKKTATKPKKGRPKKKKTSPPGELTKYSKTEDVDSRILELLGLEDVFDLDYDDYANLLKEKLIEVSKGTDNSSTEDAMFLREELKKTRGNKGKGTFRVKKKISKDSFTDFNVGQPKKDTAPTRKPAYALLSGKQTKEKSQKVKDFKDEQSEEKKERKQSDNQILKSISKSLDRVIGILSKQLEFDKKQIEKQRKLEERGKRKDKENKMESAFSKGIKSLAKVAGKIFSPLQDLFGRIVRFLTIIFLGKVVKKFIDWFTNPKNQSKVETLGRLLKTFWPAILAGLIFLNPLGRLITKAVFIIGKGVGKLLKVAIPSLLKFARKNPKLAAATALFTAGATIPMMFPGTVDEQERKTGKEVSEKGEDRTRKELERKANEPNFYERLTGQDSEAKEQLYKLDTGETKSYKRGGKITTESGKDIKGAGVDTQLIAARPGEIVINKETVNAVGADHFLGLNKQYGGANANKPKTVRGVQTASGGGLVLPAFANGGRIGEGPEESRLQKRREPPRNFGGGYSSGSITSDPLGAIDRILGQSSGGRVRIPGGGGQDSQPSNSPSKSSSPPPKRRVQPKDPVIPSSSNKPPPSSKQETSKDQEASGIPERILKSPTFRDSGLLYLRSMLGGLGGPITESQLSEASRVELNNAIARAKQRTSSELAFAERQLQEAKDGGFNKQILAERQSVRDRLKRGEVRVLYQDYYDGNDEQNITPAAENAKSILGKFWATSTEKGGYRVVNEKYDFVEMPDPMAVLRGDSSGVSKDAKAGEDITLRQKLQALHQLNPLARSMNVDMVLGEKPNPLRDYGNYLKYTVGGMADAFTGNLFDFDKQGGKSLMNPSGKKQEEAREKIDKQLSTIQSMSKKEVLNAQKYAESKGKYFSSTDGKTYASYQDAINAHSGESAPATATQKFNKGDYSGATKALGGDLSKPVPIPQITQGAIPKPKTNQQKLIEKRPWYDKFGLFGGASRLQKKEGGGYIKENSGMNVFGSADRQKIIVQPGEYVLPVDTVMKMGGPGRLDRIVANTDSNSNPARMGLRNKDISEGITPYEMQGSGGIDIETLPLSGLGGMGGSSGGLNSPNGAQDEFFSPISSAGLSERQRFMDTIGISAFG